jgi:hypothetical protein
MYKIGGAVLYCQFLSEYDLLCKRALKEDGKKCFLSYKPNKIVCERKKRVAVV